MEVILEDRLFIRLVDLKHSKVRLRGDGIIQVNFGDDTELDLKEAIEVVNAIGDLTKGEKALVLNIGGKNTTATSAARNHSASEEGSKFTIADAFVTLSLAQKILGNFYLNFHKPGIPTRIFSNEQEAIAWLKSQ